MSDKVLSHRLIQNVQHPTILIAWFTFPSEFINCTKVTYSLMFFIISKSSFFCHTFRLYLRLCSPLIFILFVIIALAKWILFLNLSVCSSNDYSILSTRAVTTWLSQILWKYDAKLLKQQLLDDFWWYFITSADYWNCIFSVIFTLTIGNPNIGYVFVSSPLNYFW